MRRKLWAWWAMLRPLQLLAVLVVALTGAFVAAAQGAPLQWRPLLDGLLVLLPVAASIHYTNEYADVETDALTRRTPFSGGSGALVAVAVERSLVLAMACVWLGLGISGALLFGLPLTAVVVLLLGAFGGWMYSLPPLKLAWRGWGELDNALLGGLLLHVYGYTLQAGRVDVSIVLVALPFTALTFINLLATTYADRTADAQVGKYTLATLWPVARLRTLHRAVGALALVLLLLLVALGILPSQMLLMLPVVLPLLLWGAATYTRWHSPAPTVYTMIAMLVGQLLIWGALVLA